MKRLGITRCRQHYIASKNRGKVKNKTADTFVKLLELFEQIRKVAALKYPQEPFKFRAKSASLTVESRLEDLALQTVPSFGKGDEELK